MTASPVSCIAKYIKPGKSASSPSSSSFSDASIGVKAYAGIHQWQNLASTVVQLLRFCDKESPQRPPPGNGARPVTCQGQMLIDRFIPIIQYEILPAITLAHEVLVWTSCLT